MLDSDAQFLGAVSTQGILNITRPEYTTSWSRDNQVAFITDGGGILVVDFVHTHEEVEAEASLFIGSETKIATFQGKDTDLENYTGVPLTTVLRNKEKSKIFDLVEDSILTPKEIPNAEVHLYYVKVGWSCRPLRLKSTNEGKFQYILGALDSHFKLRLFLRQTEQDESAEGLLEEDEWKLCVDFTESYRNLLINQFWNKDDECADNSSSGRFEQYKERMYELATVDFLWIPAWEDPGPYNQFTEGDLHTSLLTVHASGTICVWNLCVALEAQQPKFYLTLELRRSLIPGDMVRTMHFHRLTSSLGLLVIGTTEGSCQVFRVTYHGGSEAHSSRHESSQPQKYFMSDAVPLLEKDLLEVQNVSCGNIQFQKGVKGNPDFHRVTLLVFKHPNFVFPIELKVSDSDIFVERNVPPARVAQGVVAGVAATDKDNVMITLTQRGLLSWVKIEEGTVETLKSFDLAKPEESTENPRELLQLGLKKKRLQFGGLAVSSNRAMICVSKTLAEFYNHLALRTPSVLQFHSLSPTENPWAFVNDKFAENSYFFHRITDVLASFRVLATTNEHYLQQVLDWAVPLRRRTLEELQILFWFLRVQPRVDRDEISLAFNLKEEDPQTYLDLKFEEIRLQRRETLVMDRLMQLRCRDLVDKVVANPDEYELGGNFLNLQSLMTIYDFLETKTKLLKQRPLPLRPRILVDPPPRKPACPLCGVSTTLLKEAPPRWERNKDFTVKHPIDKENFEGVLWHEQNHVKKARVHPITNCILSLVPTSYPCRKCNFCGTIATLTPAFGQEPLCPLCNGIMEPPQFYSEEELEEDGEEVEKLIQEIENQRAEELRQHVASRAQVGRPDPAARIARLQKLYV